MSPQQHPPDSLLQALCEGIPATRHLLVLRTSDGRFVHANEMFCDALGYTLGELTSMTLESLHDEFELDLIERRHKLMKGIVDDGELRLKRRDGSDLWLGLYGLPHSPVDGQACRLLIGREIFEQVRRRAENEGRIQALYRAHAIAEYDLEGHLLLANDVFFSLMGSSQEELAGKTHRQLSAAGAIISHVFSDFHYEDWWHRITRGEVDEGERRYVLRSGREVWLREVFNPIFGPDGRPCKVLQAGLDVTEARIAQKRLEESINYASQIQRALHEPSLRVLDRELPGCHAVLWEPRDVVGGDCLFARATEGGLWFCLFDCTGHGAPGALLASIVLSETDRILSVGRALSPGDLLSHLNRRIKQALGQTGPGSPGESDDGLDAVVIRLDPASSQVRVASAGLPVFLVEPGSEPQVQRGDSRGIGYRRIPIDRTWDTRTLNLNPGTRIFIVTDGIFDQPGINSRVGYGSRRFAQSLQDHSDKTLDEQVVAVVRDFKDYQGDESRRDDISVAALQLPDT